MGGEIPIETYLAMLVFQAEAEEALQRKQLGMDSLKHLRGVLARVPGMAGLAYRDDDDLCSFYSRGRREILRSCRSELSLGSRRATYAAVE